MSEPVSFKEFSETPGNFDSFEVFKAIQIQWENNLNDVQLGIAYQSYIRKSYLFYVDAWRENHKFRINETAHF